MLVVSEKEESIDTANVSVVSFKEVTWPPQPSRATTLISQQPSKHMPDPPPAKRLWLSKLSDIC